jgi:hypothetical protein
LPLAFAVTAMTSERRYNSSDTSDGSDGRWGDLQHKDSFISPIAFDLYVGVKNEESVKEEDIEKSTGCSMGKRICYCLSNCAIDALD